jgi:hypothetical protein
MRKMLLRGVGVLGVALVFGLGLALTACDDLFPTTADIIVSNNSTFSSHENVTVYIYGEQGYSPLESANIPRNQSVSFSVEIGKYRVSVSAGGNSFSYPQNGSIIEMRGTVRLQFTGSQLKRTN